MLHLPYTIMDKVRWWYRVMIYPFCDTIEELLVVVSVA